jgi:hypothetical protein
VSIFLAKGATRLGERKADRKVSDRRFISCSDDDDHDAKNLLFIVRGGICKYMKRCLGIQVKEDFSERRMFGVQLLAVCF